MQAIQSTFDDLGTPLAGVTFVVVDLETTGGTPAQCGITEIGAVKVRGGELLGEFQTLVNPAEPIPAFISVLTGITDSMVAGAPRIESALPAFLEFAQGSVLVAHNARFDIGFLKMAASLQGFVSGMVNVLTAGAVVARAALRERDHPDVDGRRADRRVVGVDGRSPEASGGRSARRSDHRRGGAGPARRP